MVTVKQLKDIIQAEYDDDAMCQSIYEKLLKVLVKHEGKQITKRIETDFKKANPEYATYYDSEYSAYHLKIWGGNTKRDYQNQLWFTLGHKPLGTNEMQVIDLSRFAESNAHSNKASKEHNRLRTELLNDDMKLATIAKALNDYQDAKERIKSLLDYPLPDRYAFEKLVNYKS